MTIASPLSQDSQLFRKALDLVRRKRLYCLGDGSKFNRTSLQLLAATLDATPELLRMVGITIAGNTYLYRSEEGFFAGVSLFKQKDNFKNADFKNIFITPKVLLSILEEFKPKSVLIDFGLEEEWRFAVDDLPQLAALLVISSLARLEYIYVIQSSTGDALSMEIEGKTYALGFLDPDDGLPTITGLRQTNPHCRLEPNKPRALAKSVLLSPFEGLVINPAMESQELISKNDLQILINVCEELSPGMSSLKRAVGGLLAAVKAKTGK